LPEQHTSPAGRKPALLGVTFRPFQGEANYAPIRAVVTASDRTDGIIQSVSLADIAGWCAPSARFDPTQDLLLAMDQGTGGAPTVVGVSRLTWYTGRGGIRLYDQDSYLAPEWRGRGIWPAMVQRNERRLREIAAGHCSAPERAFQAWATEAHLQWIAVLEQAGYQTVRHFHNMLCRLDDLPRRPLPAGLEIRRVRPDHYRRIWEAQREVHSELFETVAEHWTEDRYEAWRRQPAHTPHLWQVAWDGDRVAGMVLPRIDAAENRERHRQRGYTERVFVRQPWRRRGLAGALMAESLQALQAAGMDEAELGVDAENESGAFGFYQRLGYQTYRIDIWFRKALDPPPSAA
jgi:mycothiol synthase